MLEVKDLYKKYKSKSGVIVNALNGISLKLPKKGMVFILGKSGSGKSTLLNVLGGLDSYDSGDIIIKNKSSKSFRSKDFDSYRNTYVGFIFQEYNILDNFTVGQNIALAMKLQGKKPTSEDINSILKQVDLEGLGDRKPNELSGGQKQRVAIARALIKNPQIIMADEPTGALDSATGIQIFNTLKKLSSDKLVLIVSHDREFSERYADRIIEIKDGKVLSDVSLKSTGKAIKQNIIFATNEILVNHDYVLTGKDLKEINAFIRKNKSDTRIKAIKNEMRGRASFANTDQNKVIVDKGEFEVIKSRLPFSHAFKMGAGALKHKKFKLVLTIFLSLVSFTMLGLTSTFTFFRGPTALIDNWTTSSTIDFYNISKIGIQRISGFFGNMNYSGNIGLEDEDCQRIKTELSDIGYTFLLNPVYKDPDGRKYSQTISLYNNIGEQSSGHGVFLESFKYLGKSSDFQEYFGSYKLAGGKWPSASKEIVISRSIAQTFMKFGYCEAGKYPKETVEIYSIDKMIGKELTFTLPGLSESNNFKVVGVLESGLDMTDSKYESIISSSGSSSNNKYYNEFNNLKEFSLSNAIVFSDDDYKIAESSGCTKTIFGSLPTDRSKLNKLANFVFKEYPSNLGSQYSYCSSMIYGSSDLISSTIRQTMAMTSSMKNIFLIIGLVFIVFSGLLFANFIANSISYQKKEIGILRAIGSRGSDVFRIYMCESFVIAMINFLLATVASWCVTNFAINPSVGSALSSLTGGTVSLLHFGLYSILIILGVSLLSAFLSTFIPIRNTAKKKPVEAIRNK